MSGSRAATGSSCATPAPGWCWPPTGGLISWTQAERALPALGPGVVYADANTAPAGHKLRLADLAEQAGVPFADIAIMAPVPPRGLRTPMLASGPAAAAAAGLLNRHGASVCVLPGPASTAATRKLLRSVFYQGMAAAVVEVLRAARAAGQEDWLREHIAAELAAADEATAQRLEHGSCQHAARRAHEMAATCSRNSACRPASPGPASTGWRTWPGPASQGPPGPANRLTGPADQAG